jgi:hypothetical protein
VVSGKPLSKLSCVCLPLGKLVNGKHFPSCIHSPMDTLSSSIYPSHNLTQLCDISMKGTHLLKNLALHIMNGLQSDRWSTQWTFFKGWCKGIGDWSIFQDLCLGPSSNFLALGSLEES